MITKELKEKYEECKRAISALQKRQNENLRELKTLYTEKADEMCSYDLHYMVEHLVKNGNGAVSSRALALYRECYAIQGEIKVLQEFHDFCE